MAIYSLRMTAVGKTTQKQPYTAAAHLKYITRKAAVTHVLAARMPEGRRQAVAWLKHQEQEDRKNARVIDKLVLALPRELSSRQQHELVHAFAEELTEGRASWFAAFHTKGKDADNPHCHLILRDRDTETGRRVMFLSAGVKEAAERKKKGKSAPTTLKAIRLLWERHANVALGAAGRAERIDRRTLKEQGVGRKPQVHEGPNIRAMQRRGYRPRSVERVMRNRPGRRGRSTTRVVHYPDIDRGLTRAEYNDALKTALRPSWGRDVRRPAPALAMPPVVPTLSRQVGIGQATVAALPPSQPAAPVSQPAPPVRPMTLTELLAAEQAIPLAQPRTPHDRGRGR